MNSHLKLPTNQPPISPTEYKGIRCIIHHPVIDSTNEAAKRLLSTYAASGTLILADTQTAGKGRLGRSFVSDSTDSIYMSLIVVPKLPAEKLPELTILAAYAMSAAIDKLTGAATQIKWPNDILLSGRKIVGILTESVEVEEHIAPGSRAVIIGIGANINNESFPKSVGQKAGSIYMATGTKTDKDALLTLFFEIFFREYDKYVKHASLTSIVGSYNQKLLGNGSEIFLIPYGRTAAAADPYTISTDDLPTYTCLGINADGDLMVRDSQGQTMPVSSGEISVRFPDQPA